MLIGPDGDVVLDEQGLHFVSGIPAIVQAVRIRLQFFLAEWFLNQDIGVPYWQSLLGDQSKVAGLQSRARAAFAAAILDAPGVLEILQLSVTLDAQTRVMSVTWQARAAFGDTPVNTLTVGQKATAP